MTPLEVVGHAGNVCFFSRWIVQWIVSERAQESRAPQSFFWLSLSGTVCLLAYTLERSEHILLAGFSANMLFYARNLVLARRPSGSGRSSAFLVVGAACALLVAILASAAVSGRHQATSAGWLACGIAGQVMFGGRFAVQWWFSELRGRSHFPAVFWWLSLGGNGLLLAYTLNARDVVLIVGQATAWIVPIRNLVIEHGRAQRAISAPPGTRACRQPTDT